MKKPSLGAFHALLAIQARWTTLRTLHSIRSHQKPNGAGSGGKPSDESNTAHNDDFEASLATETVAARTRGLLPGPLRSRQTRRRAQSALPPVELPPQFLNDNISRYDPNKQPRIPDALLENVTHKEKSRLFTSHAPLPKQTQQAMEAYFQTALTILLLRDCELAVDFKCAALDTRQNSWDHPEKIERVVRLWDMILDSAWHLVDLIYPARRAEYTYRTRPFWWWSIHKDLDPLAKKLRGRTPTYSSLEAHICHAEIMTHPLSHAVADLPVETLSAMQKTLGRELQSKPPSFFNPKTSKRPITILSMTGYGGKAVAESVGEHLSFWSQADLIHLDAQDLSILVGDYLGSNWAYSRTGVSMMGFRAAELNGKLSKETPDASNHQVDEEENDVESSLVSMRADYGSLDDELQKIKQGDYDCFSKWDSLKIDKLLDCVIRVTENKTLLDELRRPVLLHLHDIVELSMTLEGTLLIGRLRTLVDAAWHQGMRIAIIGTSSCNQPSSEYEDAVKQLSITDWVITRHLEIGSAENRANAESKLSTSYTTQQADYFFENIHNINRMMRSLDPQSSLCTLRPCDEKILTYLRSGNHKYEMLRDSILPVPEVYHLACAIKDLESRSVGAGPIGLLERCAMGPLTQKSGQRLLEEEARAESTEMGERQLNSGEAKPERRGLMKLNEYEKRISSGHVNRENLRTTFADVHVPQETKSALNLLTSLALIRPDAFAYGVLAQERIPGCLLYGPPGTGKTMLAKAVAKESKANMLEISGASINDKWVGESEKLIRAVFTLAKRLEPCIVFIDEADSLLASRSMFSNRASHREHINQFLKEWDGLEETNAFIMVATNRPFDLDDAVLRRLPRKILVDLPLNDDRLAILRLLLKEEVLDELVSLEDIAERTAHYSGSDLKNVCVAAAMAAVQEEGHTVQAKAISEHHNNQKSLYPERRILRREHFESALQQIPASISDDMASLKLIRKFDDEYGSRRGSRKKSSLGFGVLDRKSQMDSTEARIRP